MFQPTERTLKPGPLGDDGLGVSSPDAHPPIPTTIDRPTGEVVERALAGPVPGALLTRLFAEPLVGEPEVVAEDRRVVPAPSPDASVS